MKKKNSISNVAVAKTSFKLVKDKLGSIKEKGRKVAVQTASQGLFVAKTLGARTGTKAGAVYDVVKTYIKSEKFESDLDRFAKRIDLDFLDVESSLKEKIESDDRAIRLQAKVKLVFEKSVKDVVGNPKLRDVVPFLLPGNLKKKAGAIARSGHALYLLLQAISIIRSEEDRKKESGKLV